MADQTAESASEAAATTRLAFERTRLAYENTLMSWIRTATSLITFGFSIYKFFQLDLAGRTIKHHLIGPREFALALIGIGLLSLLLGTIQNRQGLKAMREEYPGMPRSIAASVAVLIAAIGIVALLAVIFRD